MISAQATSYGKGRVKVRDIKFRAWDKDNFEMFTYDNIGDVIFGLENNGTVSLFICDSEESPNVDIMQFTGMQDPNGVDIYQGDIINYGQGRVAEIVKWKGRFTMKGINFSDGTPSCIVDFYTYPVIGNIHQNPELTAVESKQ